MIKRFQRVPAHVINLSIILFFLIALFWILLAIYLGMLSPG